MEARKRHLIGFETEFMVLEQDGSVSTRADELIREANKCRLKFALHKDLTHNMVEISSVANVRVRKGAHFWLKTIEKVIVVAKKMGLRIYPYGTYHGTYVPMLRDDAYYKMCGCVLGEEKYAECTGRVCGFHLHYCLPYGTFNRGSKSLRQLFHSRYKEQLLSLYNLLVAADPAVTNFMESSPFVNGMHGAKDSRLFLYRSMILPEEKLMLIGQYSEQPLFGELPRYSFALADLIMAAERRQAAWKEQVGKKCPQFSEIAQGMHPLQFNWAPLRINRVGTFEYRGMDINLPSHMIGTSVFLKYMLKVVKDNELKVQPSDIGIKEPFKLEGEVLHVPPYSYLNDVLQYRSARYGLADNEVYKYTKRMSNFAFCAMPGRKDPALERIKHMLSSRKTRSDGILDSAKKIGWNTGIALSQEQAYLLALEGCDELESEVEKMISKELLIDSA